MSIPWQRQVARVLLMIANTNTNHSYNYPDEIYIRTGDIYSQGYLQLNSNCKELFPHGIVPYLFQFHFKIKNNQ